ncbi:MULTISPECIES: hypothetical protein [Chryseobacterium]|uniref:Uncharacterized protein n=1 Tax=Candidatus Chryseobacterium massiliense TaxID=204089 RepID=A0A3D9BB39_9FLAO|nr:MULTISPECIES: hypothetical protein [Chryseobacterium]REC50618.1 hypothetical protein DRF68_08980 [Candidatus Chryseobacterium massiliae]
MNIYIRLREGLPQGNTLFIEGISFFEGDFFIDLNAEKDYRASYHYLAYNENLINLKNIENYYITRKRIKKILNQFVKISLNPSQ